jgi:hypothetical protein
LKCIVFCLRAATCDQTFLAGEDLKPTFPDAAQIETPSVPRILYDNDSHYFISEHLFDQPAQRCIAARRTLIGLRDTGYCGKRKDTADAVLGGPARAGWSSWSCSG